MWLGQQTGANAPRSIVPDRAILGWGEVAIYPGESIAARINSTPSNRSVFRLVAGLHELRGECEITRPITLLGDVAATLKLFEDGRLYLNSSLVRVSGVTFLSDSTHLTSMLHTDGAGSEILHNRFLNADRRQDRGATWNYPLQLGNTADRSLVLGNTFYPDSIPGFSPIRYIYLGDTTDFCTVTGNHLCYDVTGLARDVISMKLNRDNECGQAASTPAGTYRSFTNYADVEVR